MRNNKELSALAAILNFVCASTCTPNVVPRSEFHLIFDLRESPNWGICDKWANNMHKLV